MRSLKNKTRVLPPDGDFIYGRIKDDSPGVKDGTPVNELLYGDTHQFFERLMDEAGVVPNDLPESEYSGFQLFEALNALLGNVRKKIITLPAWNMNSVNHLDVNHGLDVTKIRSVSVIIHNDLANTYYDFLNYFPNTGLFSAGVHFITSSVIELIIDNSSLFATDSAFDDAVNSRGKMIIEYEV